MLTQVIKNETKALHDELENLPLLKQLLSANALSIECYTDILSRFYSIIYPIETSMMALPHLGSYTFRFRYQALKSDLEKLNVDVRKINMAPNLINVDVESKYIGAQYLLEGAQHGAQVISKNLQKNYADYPQSYFHSSLQFSHRDWSDFKKNIDGYDTLKSAEVISTVKHLYSCFIQQFKA